MNNKRRASLSSQKNHLSHDLLQQYLFGQLPNRTMHQVERHLLDCDFCSDAAEGMYALGEAEQIARNVDELKERLHKRVSRRRFILPFGIQPYAIAASIILLVTCVLVVWLSSSHGVKPGKPSSGVTASDSTTYQRTDSVSQDHSSIDSSAINKSSH